MRDNVHFEIVRIEEIAEECRTPDEVDSRPVVLVVDDEHLIADTLAIILTAKGYMAIVAYDAEGAFELANLIPPDLLLSDVGLPGQSGIELAIRMQAKSCQCKVLLFSGQGSSLDLLASAREKGHHFTLLAKPMHPTDLLGRISVELGPAIPPAAQQQHLPSHGAAPHGPPGHESPFINSVVRNNSGHRKTTAAAAKQE